MALEVGSRPGYDTVTLICEGGMGQVYQATDTKPEKDVVGVVWDDWFTIEEQGSANAA